MIDFGCFDRSYVGGETRQKRLVDGAPRPVVNGFRPIQIYVWSSSKEFIRNSTTCYRYLCVLPLLGTMIGVFRYAPSGSVPSCVMLNIPGILPKLNLDQAFDSKEVNRTIHLCAQRNSILPIIRCQVFQPVVVCVALGFAQQTKWPHTRIVVRNTPRCVARKIISKGPMQ